MGAVKASFTACYLEPKKPSTRMRTIGEREGEGKGGNDVEKLKRRRTLNVERRTLNALLNDTKV
jgi:hypothetical protein